MNHPRAFIAALMLSLLTASRALAAAPAVDATLEPAQISVGESAQMTVLASGSGTLTVSLPVVSGLEFRVIGQSRRVQIINGAAISSTSTIIRVTPEVPGIFTIPGLTPSSPPLVLRVTPAGSSNNSAPLNDPTGRAPILPGGNLPNGIRLSPDGSAFIRLDLPKRDIFVGESIPVEIQVGMRQGFAGVNGLPTLNSSDFTLNNLSHQPEQTERTLDGKPFTVITWHSLIAAVKPGNFSLTVEAPFRVRIRTQSPRESLLDDLLGDPFLQNMFGASVMKDIVVTSPQAGFTVLPLPTEGRPKDFSGAVGTFKIASELSSPTATVGDPLTLRMHVTGSGNFDRVDSPMLSGDVQWKTYLPKSSFTPADPTGYKGEKIFEQPVIATQPGAHTIPALSFNFFDPTTRHYEAARSAPLNVTITPSVADTATASSAPAPGTTVAQNAEVPQSGLSADHADTGPSVSSLRPLYFQSRFLVLPSIVAFLFAAAWLTQRRRERAAQSARSAQQRLQATLDALLTQMQAAAAAGDSAVFFAAARSALQHILGGRWQIPPPEVSAADLDSRLGPGGAALRPVFTLADEANYSGQRVGATDFEKWTQTVRRELDRDIAP